MIPLPGPRINGAIIDLAAVRDNAAVLLRRAGSRRILADLRSDAYGHGRAAVLEAALAGGISALDRSIDPRSAMSTEVTLAGAELYGLTADRELRPAMRVSALVLGSKVIDAGESVSYGYTWTAARRTTLALVGIGYADGLDRIAGNVGSLRLRGAPRPVVGRVAMNVLVLDLGGEAAEIGDEAVVFGDPADGEPAVWEWAGSLGKPAAEVVSVFGSHLERTYR